MKDGYRFALWILIESSLRLPNRLRLAFTLWTIKTETTMSTATNFRTFFDNIKITNHATIETRYEEITLSLNKRFRDLESRTRYNLQVGSYGRWTAIKGISDLDMLYIMPGSAWQTYNKAGGQSSLLTDVKNALLKRYPNTNIYVDRLVVCVTFASFHVEVQPVFEQADGSFKYPDTYNGGSWKITKPREEIEATRTTNDENNGNLRYLCKMIRAWKNKHGIGIGGLLIDTLAHNFLKSTTLYADKSFSWHDWMIRDFFKYASELPVQDRWAALGSRQHVKVKQKFQKSAKKAHELCVKAIDASGEEYEGDRWKKVLGREFPSTRTLLAKASMESLITNSRSFRDTEQQIEDQAPVDIRYPLNIDCEVIQNGFRERLLSELISLGMPLRARKNLKFHITKNGVPEPYDIKWKVLNIGEEAERRDCIRGQIFDDYGRQQVNESTTFKGDHLVECYILKNGVVVARDQVLVPISETV
ncbi:nucleotidyltransferase [Pseudomonas sp. V104_6]|uniref:SMODS domain-containing nucleotidyltransferase n=1 Tax=Pseudomonas sp. V104_6 TaxID=3044230 RepID=UPI00249F79DE|nr:nucleotidyltransferase [Pseudomonas sp. V104_6]MDI3373708.1 nucleotidyltransferase [Pseudomonas sp. V104_6]